MLALTFQIGQESIGLDIRRVGSDPAVKLQPHGSADWLAECSSIAARIPVVDLAPAHGPGRMPAPLEQPNHLAAHFRRRSAGQLFGLLAGQVADLRGSRSQPSCPQESDARRTWGTWWRTGRACCDCSIRTGFLR